MIGRKGHIGGLSGVDTDHRSYQFQMRRRARGASPDSDEGKSLTVSNYKTSGISKALSSRLVREREKNFSSSGVWFNLIRV